MQVRFLYIVVRLKCYLNKKKFKNLATKRRKDQGRFHDLLASQKVNCEPPTLLKTDKNELKR